jgi:hypothetical protein
MAYFLKGKDDLPLMHDGGVVFMAVNENVVKGVDMNQRLLHMTGTAEVKDRDGDLVVSSGGKLENYLKNPVFLWSHTYSGPASVPLGKTVKLVKRKNPNRIDFTIQFSSMGLNPFADMVLALYNEKIINASSIGFIPREWEKMEADDKSDDMLVWRGRKFTAWELLELSGCAVPANPAALQHAIKGYAHPQTTENDRKSIYQILLGEKVLDLKTAGVDELELQAELQDLNCEVQEVDDAKVQVQVPGDVTNESATEKVDLQGVDNTEKNEYITDNAKTPETTQETEVEKDTEDIDNKGICGSRSLPTSDKDSWDGSGARSRMANAAGGPDKDKINWSTYAKGFVWVDPAKKDSFGGYKLPFADVVGGKLTAVWGGVKAAMGAVLGARGGTQLGGDKKAAYGFLKSYYSKFGKDAPEFHSIEGFEKFLEETFDIPFDTDTDNQPIDAKKDMVEKLLALVGGQGEVKVVSAEEFLKSLLEEVQSNIEIVPTIEIVPNEDKSTEKPEQTTGKSEDASEEELLKLNEGLKTLAASLRGLN